MSSQQAKKKKQAGKIKKTLFKDKPWYEVFAPRIFNNKSIGKIIGFDNNLVGRVVETLYYDFTNNYRDINLKLRFRIVDVNPEAKTCNSVFCGHAYTNDFIRSLIGRGSSKIQDIENLETKDNYKFRLTTVCTTIRRARSSQMIIIRKIMRDILREFAKALDHEKFIQGMISGEFSSQIGRVAKTIYPLSNATITKSKLITIPVDGQDTEKIDNEYDFEIIEVDVKRSRKSDIKRTERINVKRLTQGKRFQKRSETKKAETPAPPADKTPVDTSKETADKKPEETPDKETKE